MGIPQRKPGHKQECPHPYGTIPEYHCCVHCGGMTVSAYANDPDVQTPREAALAAELAGERVEVVRTVSQAANDSAEKAKFMRALGWSEADLETFAGHIRTGLAAETTARITDLEAALARAEAERNEAVVNHRLCARKLSELGEDYRMLERDKAAGVAEGRALERKDVVSWIRDGARPAILRFDLADRIERGDHVGKAGKT